VNSTSNELPSDLTQVKRELSGDRDTVQNWLSYLVTGGMNLGIYKQIYDARICR